VTKGPVVKRWTARSLGRAFVAALFVGLFFAALPFWAFTKQVWSRVLVLERTDLVGDKPAVAVTILERFPLWSSRRKVVATRAGTESQHVRGRNGGFPKHTLYLVLGPKQFEEVSDRASPNTEDRALLDGLARDLNAAIASQALPMSFDVQPSRLGFWLLGAVTLLFFLCGAAIIITSGPQ
jgi:hypothetical protein